MIFFKEPHSVQKGSALEHMKSGIQGFKYIFTTKGLRGFALNHSIISGLLFLMFWYYQSLLIENNFPSSFYGFITAGFNGLGMVLLLLIPLLQRKLKLTTIITLTSLIPGLLYISLFFNSSLIVALIAIFGITSLRQFRAPLMTTAMNTYIEDTNRATVLSGVSMLERAVIAIMYIPLGLLSDISLSLTFLVLGVITSICAITLRIKKI